MKRYTFGWAANWTNIFKKRPFFLLHWNLWDNQRWFYPQSRCSQIFAFGHGDTRHFISKMHIVGKKERQDPYLLYELHVILWKLEKSFCWARIPEDSNFILGCARSIRCFQNLAYPASTSHSSQPSELPGEIVVGAVDFLFLHCSESLSPAIRFGIAAKKFWKVERIESGV